MLIHKCDLCHKEMGVWFELNVKINALDPKTNVGPYLNRTGYAELCVKCYNDMLPKQYQFQNMYKRRAE